MHVLPTILSAGYFDSHDKYTNVTVTRQRLVTEYELELYDTDSGILHVNGSSYPVKKGNILLTCPGDLRYSTLHFGCHFIHFKTSDALTIQMLQSLPRFFYNESFDELAEIFSRIYRNRIFYDEYSVLLNASDLLSLICTIRANFCNPSKIFHDNTSKYQILMNAIEFINKNYASPIGISHIADHCNVSTSYLYKLFSQQTKSTPNNYLINTRINASKDMLLLSNMSLSEIAISCGFSSQSYFCQCFKHIVQTTPTQFRDASDYKPMN